MNKKTCHKSKDKHVFFDKDRERIMLICNI